MATNSEKIVSGATQNVEYAGFWARVAAYFLDYAILMIIFLVIGIGASFAGGAAPVIGAIAIFLISLLYFPTMESSARQATFGKSLAGIKVTDLDGKRLSFGRALLRTIAKILSAIPLSIGFLLAAFTKRKQALHDMLAKCLVVRTGPSHLLKTVGMAVGGLVIVVGSGGAYFYYVYLPQMQSDFAGAMQEAAKGASTAQPVAKVAKPATPQIAKEPSPASSVPAVPKSDVAVAGSPSSTTVSVKPSATTPGITATAAKPAKPVPTAPVQTHQQPSTKAAAITDQKALAKSPRNIEVAGKSSTPRPKWHDASTDLRHCLDLPSNEAIAKCAGE